MALEIKEGYIYVSKAATFATHSVVKRGTYLRLEGVEGGVVCLVNPATETEVQIVQRLFDSSFELFEPTIVSPRAAFYDNDSVDFKSEKRVV